MLHDMVNDILASDGMTEKQKQQAVKQAIWMVSAEAHKGEKPGESPAAQSSGEGRAGERGSGRAEEPVRPGDFLNPEPRTLNPEETLNPALHDHRFFAGMPGMGLMKGMTPELMWMPGMGWMSLQDCHHCSMPLWEGGESWRNPSVIADGWAMRVRCPLCARDMAAETKGRAILQVPTEDPDRLLVAISDEQGNLKGNMLDAVFLEEESSHAGCDHWSRAFTSRAAFDSYIREQSKEHPELSGAKPLSFADWSQRQGKKPDTYVKPKGPAEHPSEETGK
jgi:hypothetical protein